MKFFNPWNYNGENNHPEKSCFKWRPELVKANKKYYEEQSVPLFSYSIQPSNSYSNVECIMDYGASNHMFHLASLFISYDIKEHT